MTRTTVGLFAVLVALPVLGSAQDAAVTYHEDVLPLLQERCQGCHRPGEAAPFSMLTYQETRPCARAMKRVVESREMPPWGAEPGVGQFANDQRLTRSEVDLIARWADAGAPAGDIAKAPPPLRFTEGWNIGEPDRVFEMPTPFEVPATGTVDYQWIVIPTGFEEDTWIQKVEVRPGDRSVVHHVLAFYRQPGSTWLTDATPGVPTPKGSGDPEAGMSDGTIGGYVPGLPPTDLPDGRALFLPAGSDLVLQLHYTTVGTAASDQTKVGIVFARAPVEERFLSVPVVSNDFVIPPGAADYRVDAEMTLDADVRVIGFTPHMHLRGRAFEYRAVFPDGRREVLLRVPDYDFNWQLTYELQEERIFPSGTIIEASAWYDNSPANRFNPDPDAEVRWGDQTWDEMMAGFVEFAVSPDQDRSTLVRQAPVEGATSGP